MRDPFQDAVSTFEALKKKFQAGDLSRQQFIDEMKKLRLKDDQGRYWMIGAQTGKWYYFDGRDWIAADPPVVKEKGQVCIFCGYENRPEAEACGRCGGTLEGKGETALEKCPRCGGPLEKPLLNCPRCEPKGADLKTVEIVKLDGPMLGRDGTYALRSVKSGSMFAFLGVLGALAGAAYGVFAGATGSLVTALASKLPPALADQQGRMLGGAIDGLGCAVLGFVLLGVGGFLLAALANLGLALCGGLKIRLAVPMTGSGKAEDGKSEPSDEDGLGFNLLRD